MVFELWRAAFSLSKQVPSLDYQFGDNVIDIDNYLLKRAKEIQLSCNFFLFFYGMV